MHKIEKLKVESGNGDGGEVGGGHRPPLQRNLKCSLSAAEFGAMRWAAARSGPPGQPAQSLADFMRAAVRERAQAVAARETAAGREVPENINETLKG